ncbi:MAG: ankyrin repeat domain-containing protein, partial [bacterium]|nr:ankyrin repeat domain-containing protein [bacterium]
ADLSVEKWRVKKDLSLLETFMKHRPTFIRNEIRGYFKTGEFYLCKLNSAPMVDYRIDGYPERGNYRGHYFKGKTITVKITSNHRDMFSHWRVNGRKDSTPVLRFPVDRDTVILPVMKNEELLIAAARTGDISKVKRFLTGEPGLFTFQAMIEAVNGGHEEVVKFLIEKGADVRAEVDKNVSFLTHALTCNQPGIAKILKDAGAEISLEQIKHSDEAIRFFISEELTSPRYKELNVWHPLRKKQGKISPALRTRKIAGEFDLEFEKEGNRNLLIVSNRLPGKDGEQRVEISYSAARLRLNMKDIRGRYLHVIAAVKIPEHLINETNTLFIRDFEGRWEKEESRFRSGDWHTCLMSKKIRAGSTNLAFGFTFTPVNTQDKLKIKDIKVFVSQQPITGLEKK